MKKSAQLTSTLGLCLFLSTTAVTFAQTGTGTTGTGTGGSAMDSARTDTATTEDDDDGPDLGWLGLLGLAGLAGLRKKPEHHVVHQTDAPRTGSNGPINR